MTTRKPDDDKIISLADKREKRDGPDEEFVYRDEKGVKWLTFTARYNDGESEFGFRVWATDFADAERRLQLIKENGRIDGQLFGEVPS